jgi:hypothetical protein
VADQGVAYRVATSWPSVPPQRRARSCSPSTKRPLHVGHEEVLGRHHDPRPERRQQLLLRPGGVVERDQHAVGAAAGVEDGC